MASVSLPKLDEVFRLEANESRRDMALLIRAPFEVLVVQNTQQTLAVGEHWYIAPFRLHRMRVFGSSRSIVKWGYWRETFLGQMLLSLPSLKMVWRPF